MYWMGVGACWLGGGRAARFAAVSHQGTGLSLLLPCAPAPPRKVVPGRRLTPGAPPRKRQISAAAHSEPCLCIGCHGSRGDGPRARPGRAGFAREAWARVVDDATRSIHKACWGGARLLSTSGRASSGLSCATAWTGNRARRRARERRKAKNGHGPPLAEFAGRSETRPLHRRRVGWQRFASLPVSLLSHPVWPHVADASSSFPFSRSPRMAS